MNTKQIDIRAIVIFGALALAGIAIAVSAQIVSNDFAKTLMVAIGCAIFGSGLTFFLVCMSNTDNKQI